MAQSAASTHPHRDWFSVLESSLSTSRCATRCLQIGAGRLLVTIYAARILGCELPGVSGNIFYHNPQLEDPQTAAAPLQAASGNIGGDRLWIAPEIAYMWPSTADARRDPFNTSRMLPQLDPADWHVEHESTAAIHLRTAMTITDQRTGQNITLALRRKLEALDDSGMFPGAIKSLSFSLTSELTVTAGDPGALACTWDLLQIPPGGTLVVPTHGPVPAPRSYYNPWGSLLQSAHDRINFTVTGQGSNKFGLSPTQTTGRMAYLRKVGDLTTLIFRSFQPQPAEPYVDVPITSDERFGGDALQVFNGYNFGEMEVQDPGLIAGQGPTSRTNRYVTHVLAGPDKDVREAGRKLLGLTSL